VRAAKSVKEVQKGCWRRTDRQIEAALLLERPSGENEVLTNFAGSGLCFKHCSFRLSASRCRRVQKGCWRGLGRSLWAALLLETTCQTEGTLRGSGRTVSAYVSAVFWPRATNCRGCEKGCWRSSDGLIYAALSWDAQLVETVPQGTDRKPGFALQIAGFAGHCELLQKARKRVLTGNSVAHISRHFRSGADCSSRGKRAPAPVVWHRRIMEEKRRRHE